MVTKDKTEKDLLAKGLALLPEVKHTELMPAAGEDWHHSLGEGEKVRIDFGRHITGRFSMRLGYVGAHPDAPVKLQIRFAEVPWEFDEEIRDYHGWICSGWVQEEQIHVDTLPAEVRMERRYAFRYVEIQVMAISSKFRLLIEGAKAVAETSADEQMLRPYVCACAEGSGMPSERIHRAGQLDRIACATLRDCMQHVFEDGPKRDRRLWMGDLRMQAMVNYETYRQNDMVKGCLYLFAALASDRGQIPAAVFMEPEPCADDTFMFDYSLLFVEALEDYYMATRDMQALQELWPAALRQIEIAEERLDDHGLVRDSDKMGWCFLDWTLELNKQAGAQGVLLYALLSAIRLADVCDTRETKVRLAHMYARCREAALTFLYDEDSGVFVSGAERQKSYASQIWMILGGVLQGKKGGEVLTRIGEYPDAVKIVTPYLYHHYIQALLECGMRQEAMDKLLGYWGGMADQGADTFWELYDPENPKASPYGGTIVNSYCHAWSCGPSFFLRNYFGNKLGKIRGVIFDLDGVLVSTDDYHYRAWKAVADELDIPFDRKVNERLRGVSRMDSLEIILEKYEGEPLNTEQKAGLAERKNQIYRTYLEEMSPSDVKLPVREMLTELKRRRYRLAVGSSSRNTKYILERTDLARYFDAVSDGSNITKSKPDPEVFLKAAEFMQVDPENCLVVEDADSGIEAAKAGGMTAAGVQGAAAYEKTDIRLRNVWELTGYLGNLS